MYSLRFPVSVAANASNVSNHTTSKPLTLSSFPKNHVDPCKSVISSLVRLHSATTQKCCVSANENVKNIQVELPAGLEAELMPKHVVVIMDGNRRWAIQRGFPSYHGHRVGAEEAMIEFARNCLKYGVKVVTLFAVSTENFVRRPEVESKAMMNLVAELIISNIDKLLKNDVRLSFMGSRGQLPPSLQKLMSDAEERTKENKTMHVLFTMNYGGRYDIVQASKKIVAKVKTGALQVEDIDEALLEQHLETNVIDEFCNPDLLIRSSGELRTSNCGAWQLAYTEMFFTKKLFPEFDEMDLIEAITAFQNRKRRFGGNK